MTRRTSAGRPGRALAPQPQAAPVQFEHQPELRALMMFPTLPPGHMAFLVEDDAFHPHLHRGEFAVVDLADHQPAQGELFLISYSSPYAKCGLTFALCQMRSRPCYFRRGVGWQSPNLPDEGGCELVPKWTALHGLIQPGRLVMAEGPFTTEHAASKLVGRVVGVFVPKVEEARASAS